MSAMPTLIGPFVIGTRCQHHGAMFELGLARGGGRCTMCRAPLVADEPPWLALDDNAVPREAWCMRCFAPPPHFGSNVPNQP